MAWDIYGNQLRSGYCEVHPSVHEGYPCSVCQEDQARAYQDYDQQPGPCEGCYYATGDQRECDGTCETLPYPDWDYFKSHPDETPPELLPTMTQKGDRP